MHYDIGSHKTDVECKIEEYGWALSVSPYFLLFNHSPVVLKNPSSLCLRLHRRGDLNE